MKYSYTCPSCNWIGDRIVRMEERDEQECDQLVDGSSIVCGAKLIKEEISVTARMSNQWQRWTGRPN